MSTDKAKASKGKVDAPTATVQPVLTPNFSAQLNSMFNDFYEKTKADKEENRLQFAELRTAISALSNPVMSQPSPIDSPNLSAISQTFILLPFKTDLLQTFSHIQHMGQLMLIIVLNLIMVYLQHFLLSFQPVS